MQRSGPSRFPAWVDGPKKRHQSRRAQPNMCRPNGLPKESNSHQGDTIKSKQCTLIFLRLLWSSSIRVQLQVLIRQACRPQVPALGRKNRH